MLPEMQEFKSGMVSLGALTRLAVEVFKRSFKYIALISLGVYVPTGLVIGMMVERVDPVLIMQASDLSPLVWFSMIASLLSVAVMPLATAATTYLAAQRLTGAEVTPEGLLDASFGNWLRLITAAVAYTMIVSVGFMLFFVPGVYLGILLCFCFNIIAIEKRPGIQALMHSAQIVKGRWRRTFFMLFILLAGEYAFSIVLGSVLTAVFGLLTMPLASVAAVSEAVYILSMSITDVLCMVFRLVSAFYFLNLYYTHHQSREDTANEAID